jgi:hypothetical protein
MSKTEGYSWIGAVVGGLIGLVFAVMLKEVVSAELMVVLNGGLVGFVFGWFVGIRYDISEDNATLISCLVAVVCVISITMYCLDSPLLAGYGGPDIITWLGHLFIGLIIGTIVGFVIGGIALLLAEYDSKAFGAIFCAIIGVFVSNTFADTSVATIPIFIIPIFAVIGYFAWTPLAVMIEDIAKERRRREEEKKQREAKMMQDVLDIIEEVTK